MEEEKKIPGIKEETKEEILFDVSHIKQQEIYVLPSRGLAYKPEDGIPESITLRRMTTKEEKLRLRQMGDTEILRDLLQACIVTPNVQAENLTLPDANFLMFKLRVISLLNDKYKVSIRCPHCSSTYIHELNLSEVPVQYLTEEDINNMIVELPVSKLKITLRYPNLKTIIKSSKDMEDYFDKFPNADRLSEITTRAQLVYIDSVNGNSLLSEEKQTWFESLDIVDYKKLAKAINKLEGIFGFENNLLAKCPNCGKDTTHGLPITNELFNPSEEDAK